MEGVFPTFLPHMQHIIFSFLLPHSSFSTHYASPTLFTCSWCLVGMPRSLTICFFIRVFFFEKGKKRITKDYKGNVFSSFSFYLRQKEWSDVHPSISLSIISFWKTEKLMMDKEMIYFFFFSFRPKTILQP